MDVEQTQPALAPAGASSGARMVRDSILTVGTRGFQFAVIFLKQIIIARALGTEGRGEYALIMTVYDLLIHYGRLGVSEAIVYHAGRKSGKSLEEVAGNVLSLGLLSGALMVAVTLALSGALLSTVLRGVEFLSLALMISMVPLGMVQVFFASLLQSQRRLVSFNIINAIVSLTHITAMVVALYVLNLHVRGAVIASMISVVFPALLAVAYATRNMRLRPRWNWAVVKDLITFGLKSHVTFVLSGTLAQIDLLVMNPLLGKAAVGIYAVANSLVGRTLQMPTAVSNALYPHMVASGSAEEMDRITEKAARNLLAMVLSVAVIAALGGQWLIVTIFGEEFRAAYVPFLILLIGVVPQGSFQIISRNFASRGKPLLAAIPTGLALLVNLVGDLALIPRMGMVGAAVASSAGGLVMFIAGLILFARVSQRPWWNCVVIQREDLGSYRQLGKRVGQRVSRFTSRGGYPSRPVAAEATDSGE